VTPLVASTPWLLCGCGSCSAA